jgi:hypothetical protein
MTSIAPEIIASLIKSAIGILCVAHHLEGVIYGSLVNMIREKS